MGGRLDATNTFILESPAIMAKGEYSKARVTLYGVGASLMGFKVYVIDPDGLLTDLTTTAKALPIYATFLTSWDFSVLFSKAGIYSFALLDTSTGTAFMESTIVAQWASNMDAKVSDFSNLRTEISRVRTTIKKGA